jgi:hypothetical protein
MPSIALQSTTQDDPLNPPISVYACQPCIPKIPRRTCLRYSPYSTALTVSALSFRRHTSAGFLAAALLFPAIRSAAAPCLAVGALADVVDLLVGWPRDAGRGGRVFRHDAGVEDVENVSGSGAPLSIVCESRATC